MPPRMPSPRSAGRILPSCTMRVRVERWTFNCLAASAVLMRSALAMSPMIGDLTSFCKYPIPRVATLCRDSQVIPREQALVIRTSLCDHYGMGITQMRPEEPERSPWAFGLGDRLAKALHVAEVTNMEMADYLGVSAN